MAIAREELAAERVLEDLGIVDAADLQLLDEIAYARGALVCTRPMRGAEARLIIVGARATITLSPTVTHPQRRRFSIAHELGHLELHRHDGPFSLCTKDDLNSWRSGQPGGSREQEANGFAGALLMPRRLFAPLCNDSDPSLECVASLAHQFDTSLTATAVRYCECVDEAVAVVVSHQGVVAWHRASREFEGLDLFVEMNCRLAPTSLAYGIYRDGIRTSKARRVSADAWLSEGRYQANASVLEFSRLLSDTGTVLTLLWVDDDISTEQFYWSEN